MEGQIKRLPTPKKAAVLSQIEQYATGPLPPYGTLTRVAERVGVTKAYVGFILRELRNGE